MQVKVTGDKDASSLLILILNPREAHAEPIYVGEVIGKPLPLSSHAIYKAILGAQALIKKNQTPPESSFDELIVSNEDACNLRETLINWHMHLPNIYSRCSPAGRYYWSEATLVELGLRNIGDTSFPMTLTFSW